MTDTDAPTMSPKQMDYVLNGAKVFVYQRPDGTRYATVHDFSRFGVEEVALVRVKLTPTSTVESVLNAPEVLEALGTRAGQVERTADYRADYSPLTPADLERHDDVLGELEAYSRPASREP